MVTAQDEAGEIVELGQIQIVQFINPEGLQAMETTSSQTANSGEPVIEEDE